MTQIKILYMTLVPKSRLYTKPKRKSYSLEAFCKLNLFMTKVKVPQEYETSHAYATQLDFV